MHNYQQYVLMCTHIHSVHYVHCMLISIYNTLSKIVVAISKIIGMGVVKTIIVNSTKRRSAHAEFKTAIRLVPLL